MDKIKIFVSVIVIVIVGVIATAIFRSNAGPAAPGEYDTFASCLGEKGAIFYGAFWCPHCKDQKDLFGSSAKLLPYVECSTLDGRGQTENCIAEKIEGYPTWEFADSSRITEVMSLEELSEKTSCPILPPAPEATPTVVE